MARILTLCSGNATRSVLLGAALVHARPDLEVTTAGTMVIDGLPMSWRTREAFEAIGVPRPDHRSKQVTPAMLDFADLVIAAAPEHLHWIRRQHPEYAARTGSLIRLAASLPPPPGPLAARVAGLGLAEIPVEGWEEVVDPGGGEVEDFIACAHRIAGLVEDLLPRL